MSEQNADIIALPRAKSIKERHRKQSITLSYNPTTKRWMYTVVVTLPVEHAYKSKGYASENIARRYARAQVDKILDGE